MTASPSPTRQHRDRGSASLTTALLTPVFIVIAFMAWQAALWSAARTEARAIARDTVTLVARQGHTQREAIDAAQHVLDTEFASAALEVRFLSAVGAPIVVVEIRGDAPGMIRGTAQEIIVTEALPQELDGGP